ncbi:hypothetical protein [Ferribacterium limneticum]|nr:hypothetical protein [Ferribacterium limneticum]UCV29596.1 hypothetical protein KI617_05750 [Ferribacterium limneticum]UCV33515.1 hypothetical protein KI608_05750 [Ferribacterium limneticum]
MGILSLAGKKTVDYIALSRKNKPLREVETAATPGSLLANDTAPMAKR